MRNIYEIFKIYILKMKTMIMNTVGLLLVAFVMFLIFKKIKSIIPTLLGCALNKEQPPLQPNVVDVDSDDELNMADIIELDEEDIDVDDLDSDTDEQSDDESVEDEPVEDEPVEPVEDEPVEVEPVEDEPVEDEPVEDEPEPVKKKRSSKTLKTKKGKTIKI